MSEDWKEVSAVWKGDMTFIGKNAQGGMVQMGSLDGKPGIGPMELVLVGLPAAPAWMLCLSFRKNAPR